MEVQKSDPLLLKLDAQLQVCHFLNFFFHFVFSHFHHFALHHKFSRAYIQNGDKFWVERLFRKKDLFYALLQKFVSQCGRLLRCEIPDVSPSATSLLLSSLSLLSGGLGKRPGLQRIDSIFFD